MFTFAVSQRSPSFQFTRCSLHPLTKAGRWILKGESKQNSPISFRTARHRYLSGSFFAPFIPDYPSMSLFLPITHTNGERNRSPFCSSSFSMMGSIPRLLSPHRLITGLAFPCLTFLPHSYCFSKTHTHTHTSSSAPLCKQLVQVHAVCLLPLLLLSFSPFLFMFLSPPLVLLLLLTFSLSWCVCVCVCTPDDVRHPIRQTI